MRTFTRQFGACGALLGLMLLGASGCRSGIKVEGSSCSSALDCRQNLSCARRVGGCSCVDGACYLDPRAPVEEFDLGCRACHGGQENPAPPRSVDGLEATSAPEVGAHQTHLSGGASARPVSCSECHLVPKETDDPGHLDDEPFAEVRFGALATAAGTLSQTPVWDRAQGSCTNYCHGATLSGGTHSSPAWTTVDGTQAACGSCHGLPPGGDHPRLDACEACHIGTAGPNLTIADRFTHVDGTVQVTLGVCSSCHGTGEDPAPPKGTRGEVATTTLAVGAHRAHLSDGPLRMAIACQECHLVPATVDAPGHVDGTAAVTFGTLARTGGVSPTWNRPAATCSGSYCHGNFPQGATTNTPVWTRVDGSAKACGTCHGNPPAAPHSPSPNCNACHPATVTASGAIDVPGGQHIDGQVDSIALSCTSCHGDPASGNAAPPVGTQGETLETQVAVGAHSAHLAPSAWHKAVRCEDCHPVPTLNTHSNSVREVSLTGLAAADGAAPLYARATATCSGVYCHGATLEGANPGGTTRRTPKWTQVDGTFNDCGTSCHTNPPGGTHIQSGQCASCHGSVVDAAGVIIAPALHVDGTVQATADACNSCHGGSVNDAPPKSSSGATSTSSLEVGAHQSHLVDGAIRKAVPCAACHLVPTASSDPGHLDPAPAEVIFGALARTAGAVPTFSRTTARCSNSYCHGATLAGGTNKAPQWTTVNGTQAACGTCHGNPPPAPHSPLTDCHSCHLLTMTAANAINVAGGHHLDGVIDAQAGDCGACHGNQATGDPAPPRGTLGQTATTSPAVGAHTAHLSASTWHRTGQCQDCHPVPSLTTHSDGVTQLSFQSPATASGANPAYNATAHTCSNVFCHGATLQPASSGTVLRVPVWTQVNGSFSACGTACHTNPPGGTHPSSTQCQACHPAVITASGTFVNPALHVNGVVEHSLPACNTCHGSTANDAPPVSTTGATTTSSLAVGAHQRHLTDGLLRKAMPCNECHLVPATVTASGHLDGTPPEVSFGALARADGATPSWARASATCGGSYCHGATLGGGTNKAPVWTTVNGTQAACGTCHGNPPPAPHPQLPSCRQCHPATVNAAGTIDVAGGKHLNAVVEQVPVHPPPSTYNTPGSGNYHGDEANRGLAACQACHGTNLLGGGAGVSCNSCHPGWATHCTYCHGGTNNSTGAPPKDMADRTVTTAVTVGTHTAHLGATHALASAVSCAACHAVPADALSLGHLDPAPAEVVFGGLARTGGVNPAWNRTAMTCTASYCHGSFSGGLTSAAPNWTNTSGTARACSACHPALPSSGRHTTHRNKGHGCDACHDTISNSAGTLIITPSLHVNGTKDIRLKPAGTWTPSNKGCSVSGCHGTKTW